MSHSDRDQKHNEKLDYERGVSAAAAAFSVRNNNSFWFGLLSLLENCRTD